MHIEIINDTLLIGGNSAGSLTDAIANFPALSAELWVAMSLRAERMSELERDSAVQAATIELLQAQIISENSSHDAIVADLKNQLAPAPASGRVITPSAFRQLFTVAQLSHIVETAVTDMHLALLLQVLYTSSTVNLDAEETVAGLNYLVSIGVLADLSKF